jgi:hypothetical protein
MSPATTVSPIEPSPQMAKAGKSTLPTGYAEDVTVVKTRNNDKKFYGLPVLSAYFPHFISLAEFPLISSVPQ